MQPEPETRPVSGPGEFPCPLFQHGCPVAALPESVVIRQVGKPHGLERQHL